MFKDKPTHIEQTGPKEVAWFVALWLAGVLTITVIGGLIRFAIMP